MANVFEVEANASQDANYREHLNRNWQNGNTEFDKLENWLNALESSINGFQSQISNMQQQISNLALRVQTANNRINELNNRINELAADVDKLNKAVFYAEYINDTKSDVEDKPSITHEINDTHVVNDDNGIIIQDEHQTLPNDVN